METKKAEIKILYIEKYNFEVFFFVMFSKAIKIIYLLDSMDHFEHNPQNKSFLEKLSCRLFPTIKIIRVPFYRENSRGKNDKDLCWQANKKALEFLDSEYFHRLVINQANVLIEKIGDDNIIIAIESA